MYRSRRYRTKELKRAQLLIRQLKKARVSSVKGFNPDSVSKGKFKPGDKPSDFAGLWKKTRPDEF